ncbi:uncharacterized [Tachysurus ichikawai]
MMSGRALSRCYVACSAFVFFSVPISLSLYFKRLTASFFARASNPVRLSAHRDLQLGPRRSGSDGWLRDLSFMEDKCDAARILMASALSGRRAQALCGGMDTT